MDSKKVSFDSNFSLIFAPGNHKHTYGFKYENFENDILISQVHYEVDVKCINTYKGFFEIKRHQVFIDNKIPQLKVEQIAEKAAAAIFPLEVEIKKNGEIETILNHTEIVARWKALKDDFLIFEKGDVIVNVLNKINRFFLNPILLKKALMQNWFLHLYFMPLYGSYSEKLKRKFICESPIFPNQPIKFGVVQTVRENYIPTDKIQINFNGIAIDERTLEEVVDGYTFSQSQFDDEKPESLAASMILDYQLYKENRSIFSVNGMYEIIISENKKRKIELEIYHLPDTVSYRPATDEQRKTLGKMFFYEGEDDEDEDSDIIDFRVLAQEAEQRRRLNPESEVVKSTREKIELFVEEIPTKEKISLRKRIERFFIKVKSIFKI